MARDIAMAHGEQRGDARDARPEIRFDERPPVDVAEDDDARLAMDHLGRQSRGVRSDARSALAIAEDVVDGNVAAASRDETSYAVSDDESRIGEPAAERFDFHFAAPARQRSDSRCEIDNQVGAPMGCARTAGSRN